MKKLLLTLLAALMLPLQASAATYYVNSRAYYAKNTNAGTSALAPKRTMAALDAIVLPGDVVRVYPGAYTFPAPDSAGSNPTGGGFITYIGTHPNSDPLSDSLAREQIVFTSEGPSKPYLSIKGVKIGAALHFGTTSSRDTICCCTITGDLEIYGGDYNYVGNNSFTGKRIGISALCDATTARSSVGNRVSSNSFYGLGRGITTGDHIIAFGKNPESPKVAAWVDSLTFDSNRITLRLEPTVNDLHPWYCYRTRRSNFNNNKIEYDLGPPVTHNACVLRMRDSSYSNQFNVDTLLASGTAQASIYWSSSGGGGALQVWGNTVDSCHINLTGTLGASRSWWYDWMNNWTVTNNLIAVSESAIWADMVKGRNTIQRNTLVGGEPDGVVNFTPRPGTTAWGDTAVALLNNSIGTFSSPTIAPIDAGNLAGLLLISAAAFDSATQMRQQDNLLMNNNSYGTYSGSLAGRSDRAILIKNGSSWIGSAAGDSLRAWGSAYSIAENRWRLDSLGTTGRQEYDRGGPDSTRGLAFNPSLGDQTAGDCAAGIVQSTCEWPRVRVNPNVATFFYGSAGTYSVTLSNIGRANATLDRVITTLPAGVTVSDDVASPLAEATDDTVTLTYDGTSPAAEGYLYIETSDRTVPKGLNPAAPTIRYIPVFVKIFP